MLKIRLLILIYFSKMTDRWIDRQTDTAWPIGPLMLGNFHARAFTSSPIVQQLSHPNLAQLMTITLTWKIPCQVYSLNAKQFGSDHELEGHIQRSLHRVTILHTKSNSLTFPMGLATFHRYSLSTVVSSFT